MAIARDLERGFFETLRSVLRGPTLFFRALAAERSGPEDTPNERVSRTSWASRHHLGRSLVFLASVFVPSLAVQAAAFYGALTSELGPLAHLPRVHFEDPSLVVKGAFFFVLGAVSLIAYLATFYQVASQVASGRRPAFRATIAGVSFGFAPMVFGLVPFIGLLVGLAWSFALHVIAVRELHGIGTPRALAVVLLPLVVMLAHFVYA